MMIGCFWSSIVLAVLSTADPIDWHDSMETAIQAAKDSGRPIVVVQTLGTRQIPCGAAKMALEQVFHDREVVALAPRFEWVWINVRNAPTVAFDFGGGRVRGGCASGDLALLFCTPKGRTFDIHPGLATPEVLCLHLRQCLANDQEPTIESVRERHTLERVNLKTKPGTLGLAPLRIIDVARECQHALTERAASMHALLERRPLEPPDALTEALFMEVMGIDLREGQLGYGPAFSPSPIGYPVPGSSTPLPRFGDFDFRNGDPLDFLEFLIEGAESEFYTVREPPPEDWIRVEHVALLMERIDSEQSCAAVISSLSSILPREPSTVGREAQFLIDGFRAKSYPPSLGSFLGPRRIRDHYRTWWASFEGRSKPPQRPDFEDALQKIAADYREWGRVDDDPHWAPTDCRAPFPGVGRLSRAKESAPHARKLYYLYAKNRKAYVEGQLGKMDAVGQVVVKETWSPLEVDSLGGLLAIDDVTGLPLARVGDKSFRPHESTGLFIMYRTDSETAGTDDGWVYGTLDAEGRVTGAGKMASCMRCHRQPRKGRLFGLDLFR